MMEKRGIFQIFTVVRVIVFLTSAKCSGHVISIEKGSEETDQIEGKLGKLFT